MIAARAMAKEPDQRFRSARSFARELRQWLDANPAGARRRGPGRDGARCRDRRQPPRRAPWIAAAALAALTVGSAAVWWQTRTTALAATAAAAAGPGAESDASTRDRPRRAGRRAGRCRHRARRHPRRRRCWPRRLCRSFDLASPSPPPQPAGPHRGEQRRGPGSAAAGEHRADARARRRPFRRAAAAASSPPSADPGDAAPRRRDRPTPRLRRRPRTPRRRPPPLRRRRNPPRSAGPARPGSGSCGSASALASARAGDRRHRHGADRDQPLGQRRGRRRGRRAPRRP